MANQSYVTWVELQIPNASSTTFSKTIGNTSPASSGRDRVTQAAKTIGNTSPASSGNTRITIYSKSLGAASAGSTGVTRVTQAAKGLGALSAAQTGLTWQFAPIQKGFGAFSTASVGIDQITAQGRNFGVTSASSAGITKIWSAAKTLGATSAGSRGITKNATFSKSLGVTSALSNGIAKTSVIPKTLGATSPGNARYDRATLHVKSRALTASAGSNGLNNKVAILVNPFTDVQDDFNRADGALGANWISPVWMNLGTITVASNRIGLTSGTIGDAAWNTQYGPDVEVYADVPVAPTGVLSLLARMQDLTSTPDGYRLIVNVPTNLWRIQRIDNGTSTVIGPANTAQAVAAGDSIMLQIIGSSLVAYYKPAGGQWQQVLATNDTTYPAAGYVGVQFNDATARLDNFAAGVALTNVNQAYVTWVELQVPNAISTTFSKSFGSSSAAKGGISQSTSQTKPFGATSAVSAGETKAYSIAKSIGASSAASNGVVKGVGAPKTFGATSPASVGIVKAVSTPSKTLGATSAATAGVLRQNQARVTWVELQVPVAQTSVFTKSIGATSTSRVGITKGLGLSAKSFGATSQVRSGIITPTVSKLLGFSTTASNGLAAPHKGLAGYYQTPFSYTITPLATKTFGAISPASSGSSKALVYTKPVGATSPGEDGLTKVVIFSKSFGAVSAGKPGLSQIAGQLRSLGASSAATGGVLRAHRYSKGLGATSAGSSGVSKLWTAPKTLGATSHASLVLDGLKVSAFSKPVGAVSAGSSGLSKTVSFLGKSAGAISAGRSGFAPGVTAGAISAGSSGRTRVTFYNKALGATSAGSNGITPHVAITIFGATSALSSGISRTIVHSKSLGAISSSKSSYTFTKYVTTAEFGAISAGSAFLTYVVPLRTYSVTYGARATGTAGISHVTLNARFLAIRSVGSSGFDFNITGLLKRKTGVFSSSTAGLKVSVAYNFLPGHVFDNTLLSASEIATLLSTVEEEANLLATRIEV